MDTALPQKFPFILDRNLAKANCTENHVCTSCDKVVLGYVLNWNRVYILLHRNLDFARCFEALNFTTLAYVRGFLIYSFRNSINELKNDLFF